VKVQLHEEAQLDIDEAALWYDEQDPGLGDEFLAELDLVLAGLSLQPEVWPVWPGSRARKYPVRRRLLVRFPYGIAYQIVGNTIVAVAADKRRPGYWASRAKR
jgi:hypothetical protein